MTLIALTGGIAAGKSTIGKRFAELGAVRIDADQLARDAVAVGSAGLSAILNRFGPEILMADGTLDRPALGAIVFGDGAALNDLNAIVHPEVRRLAEECISEARASDPDAFIVYEIPLFVESGMGEPRSAGGLEFDHVVTAEAPEAMRIARLIELRGMTEAEARSRIAKQATTEERRAVADWVIDTSVNEADTVRQTDELYSRLR